MKFSLVLASSFLMGGSLFATTVNPSAQHSSAFSYKQNANFTSSDGTLQTAVRAGSELLFGTSIALGNFNVDDATLALHAADASYLFSHFEMFGTLTAHIGDGLNQANNLNKGYFASSIPNSANPANFAGEQIYMFVVAGTDNTSISTSISSAFQLGIFYLKGSADADWLFPSVGTSLPTSIDIDDLTVGNAGTTPSANAVMVVGGFGPDKSDKITSATNFTLANVPEPVTGGLFVVGAAMLATRRRRSVG